LLPLIKVTDDAQNQGKAGLDVMDEQFSSFTALFGDVWLVLALHLTTGQASNIKHG